MKKFAIVLSLVCMVLLVAGCSEVVEVETPVTEDTEVAVDYTGLSVEEAEKLAEDNGVMFRVVMEDGEMRPATKDYRPGRINATVVDGEVVSYEVEG
jgi:PBP1b-binding outer membrane lipoprotein LpoB